MGDTVKVLLWMQFVGRLFSESDLLPVVYSYEQGTLHRKAPAGFGAID